MLKGSARGATLVEFQVVVLLCLLPLLLGLLQLGLLLLDSPVLHYATFQAARAGAVAGADPAVMRHALGVGLMPLYSGSDKPFAAGDAAALAAGAYARSMADVALYARLTQLRPDAAAFEDFATDSGQGPVIRNDSLLHRSTAAGPRSGLSVQQANVLQIRVEWCAPLVVPFVDRLWVAVLRSVDADVHSQLCYAAGRIPLRATAATNMQSDVRFHGD